MRNFSGSWKNKPPIFYVFVLVSIGAGILAIWRQYHPYDYYAWDTLIVVFVVAAIVTCLYFVRDWWVDGRERNQHFQQHLLQQSLTPLPMIHPTKIDETDTNQKQITVQRRPVKQLPPMSKRPFIGIGGSGRTVAKPSPQAVRTDSGQSGGQDRADGRTMQNGQTTSGQITQNVLETDERTIRADDQKEADKQKIVFYLNQYPGESVRQVAVGVEMGKTKVAELIQELRKEGKL